MKLSSILLLILILAEVSAANQSPYERGQQALQRGDYDRAIQHFHQALQSDPNQVDACTGLGYAYSQLGQYENAIQSYQQALRLDAQSAQAHLGLGYIAYRQGKFDDAVRFYQTVIDHGAEGIAEAYHNLGRIYAERGDIEKAITAQKAALAAKLSEAKSREAGLDFADAHYHLGSLYSRERQWGAALQEYREAVRLNPTMAEAHYQLARCYVQTGDSEAAKGAMDAFHRLKAEEAEVQRHLEAVLLADDPAKAAEILALGNVYLRQEKYPQATEQFQRVLDLAPKSPEAYAGLGHAALETENYPQATTYYERAIQLGLKTAQAHHNLGLAYMQVRNARKALEQFQLAIALNPDLPQAHLMLGTLYAAGKQFELAERHYENAITLAPDMDVAYHSLAYLYGQSDRHLEKGVELARKAIQLSPKSALYYSTLSWLLYKFSRYAEAEAAILKAIELNPDNPLYREGLEEIRKLR